LALSGTSKNVENDDDGGEGVEGNRLKGSGDSGIMGELADLGSRDEEATISGYVGSWPFSSRLLGLNSSNSENDFL
jgi:hypothetical protein